MKIHLSFETFGAIAAIIASFAALFVAWDQATIMRTQQYAAVIPIVSTDMNIVQDSEANIIELTISNVGVGPALIRSAILTLGSEPMTRWSVLSDRMLGEDFEETLQLSASTPTTVLGAGERETILGIRWARSEAGDARLVEVAERLAFGDTDGLGLDLCYCSVLGRCWVANASLDFPEPTDHCTSSGDFVETFFRNDEEANIE